MNFPDNIILIWNSMKDWKVLYTNDKILPAKYFINIVNLRNIGKQLSIYGKIAYNPVNNLTKRNIKKIHNKTLLKSNLQKAIRRGKTDEALITALNLINIDFVHFIRRLIIISIEDVGVTNNLPFLVWLLIAFPNFEMTNEIIQYLLLTIYTLSKYPYKYIPDTDICTLNYTILDYSNEYKISLLIRGEYGGMKGDISLINKFINSKSLNIIKVRIGDLVITRDITLNDIILESIDFHCFPDILNYVSNKTGLHISEIKEHIWENNSKYNFREKSQITKSESWEKMKRSVIEYQSNKKREIRIF